MANTFQKLKQNRMFSAVVIILLTVAYLFATAALAQSDTSSTNSGYLTSGTFGRDDLSYGDIWAFTSENHQNSRYMDYTGKVTYYESTAHGTQDKNETNILGYYGKITYGNRAITLDEKTLVSAITNYSYFNSAPASDSVAGNGGIIPIFRAPESGIATYTVVPSSTGEYRIYVYSAVILGDTPELQYYLIDSISANNDFAADAGTGTMENAVKTELNLAAGNAESGYWYYATVSINNTGWQAFYPTVEDATSTTSSESSDVKDTITGGIIGENVAGSITDTLLETGTEYTYYYNKWTNHTVSFNTLLVVKWDSSIQLGPITKTGQVTVTNPDGAYSGTVTMTNIFGEVIADGSGATTIAAHAPIQLTATAASNSMLDTLTIADGSGVLIDEPTDSATVLFTTGDLEVSAGWSAQLTYPSVVFSGGANPTSIGFRGTGEIADTFQVKAGTEFILSADMTGSDARISILVTPDGAAAGEATVWEPNTGTQKLTVTTNMDDITVTLTASVDGSADKVRTIRLTGKTTGDPVAKIGETLYFYIEDALMAANANTASDRIILLRDAAFQGKNAHKKLVWGYGTDTPLGYTIAQNDQLLVPFNDSHTADFDDKPTMSTTNTGASVYLCLTVPDGITINCYGAINVNATQFATSTQFTGNVTGQYGAVQMDAGSVLSLKDNSKLYAYGYIGGDGAVVAESGSSVYQLMQIRDWRGGTATSSLRSTLKGNSFIFSQFYVQNVEAKLTVYAGGSVYAVAAVSARLAGEQQAVSTLIGPSDALFTLLNGYADMKYEASTDRVSLDIYGDVSSDYIEVGLSSYSMKSSDYILPLPMNYTINIKSGSKITFTEKFKIMPGTVVNIEEGATATLTENGALYLYDVDDWKSGNYTYDSTIYQLGYVYARKGAPVARSVTDDAVLRIDGIAIANGPIYSTNKAENGGGAGITGSGTITIGVYGSTNLKEVNGSSTSLVDIACIPAVGSIAGHEGMNSFAIGTYNSHNNKWYQYTVTGTGITHVSGGMVDGTTIYTGGIKDSLASVVFTASQPCVTATNATKTADGDNRYKLGTFTGNSVVTVQEHNEQILAAVAPTCTDTGLDEGKQCTICAQITKAQGTVAALGHTLSPVEGTYTAPTCEGAGKEADQLCSLCQELQAGAEIVALGHDWDTTVYVWAADHSGCTATHTCKRDDSHTESSNATIGSQTKAATCTADGMTTFTATFNVGWAQTQTATVTIVSLGHADENDDYRCDREACQLIFIYATNINLGNNLDMLFAIQAGYWDADADLNLTATFTRDGVVLAEDVPYTRVTVVDENGKSVPCYAFTYTGFFAYQMCDDVTIEISDGTGKAITVPHSDSIRDYATRLLESKSNDEKLCSLLVDMLNYGAACQVQFEYKMGDLANKGLGGQIVTFTKVDTSGTLTTNPDAAEILIAGRNLTVGSRIAFHIAFDGAVGGQTATVTLKSHRGPTVTKYIVIPEGGSQIAIENILVVADYQSKITIEINGTKMETTIEDYLNTMQSNEVTDVFAAFADFAASAYAHLHRNDETGG